MRATRPSVATAGAAACAALALWVSFGALSFADADDAGAYVGLLPPISWLALLLIAAGLLTVVLRPSPRSMAPLWLSAVALLPWLPFPMPLSTFIWTGNLLSWLWLAIGVAVCAPAVGRWRQTAGFLTMAPRRAAVLAGVLTAVAYAIGTWSVAPQHPDGDEPHYLIITQSLLQDFDLKIENNHRQGDYEAYLSRSINPDFLKRGTDGQIYSIHAPGLPILVAPAFALFGYRGVLVQLVLIGAAAGALVWVLAWRVTGDAAASWFGWAAVALSVPFFFHASAVFPDGMGAVLILPALLPLVDARARKTGPLLIVGAALASLPWLHSRFAILAAASGIVVAARLLSEPAAPGERLKRLAGFAACPFFSATAWFLFLQIIYGTPNPSVVYGGNTSTAPGNIVRGVPGLLFDQQFGLIPNAPVYLCALAGIVVMMRTYGTRRLALELLFIAVPYFLVVGFFFMWWAGTTAPVRFLAPLTLLSVIPIALWFAIVKSPAARTASLAALLVSLLTTATMASVDRGAFVFNFRDGISRVARWLSPVVDLTRALPSLFQNPPPTVLLQAAIWGAALASAVAVGFALNRRGRAAVVLGFGLTLQLAAMIAVASVWRTNGAAVATPYAAGPALLRRYDPAAGQIAIAYRPFERLERADLPGRIVLARALTSGTRADSPSMARLPAGVYEVTGTSASPATGHIRLRTDRVSGPIADWDAAALDSSWSRQITLPVAVASLAVEADAGAKNTLHDVRIRAVSVLAPEAGMENREARRASRYGPAVVFLLGGDAWVEPAGIWVAAGSSADFAIALDAQTPLQLFVRNGPVENGVTLESGAWHERLALKPGEERIVQVPADSRRRTVPLKVAPTHGFRPADFDPKSQDVRELGVWIETR